MPKVTKIKAAPWFAKMVDEARQSYEYWWEDVSYSYTEQVLAIIEKGPITLSKLTSKLLCSSPKYIKDQICNPERLTFVRMVKIAYQLGYYLEINLKPIDEDEDV